uniref:Uncharacterized protein n=1 Tax=Alloyangia mangrovi TaxID=1779329 RepID=A0A2A3JYQ1_9RHOB
MLAVVAGIFFLGGWAWFAYFQGRDVNARSLPAAHDGLSRYNSASLVPGAGSAAPGTEAYARKVFGGLLPIEDVLASKPVSEGEEGCTYAIIRTGSGVANTPPTSTFGTAWWERFGGDWRQSPERLFGALPVDVLAECRGEWQAELGAELQQALDAPGNWYMRSATAEDLHIFSADGRLAARIRLGS